MSKKNNGTLAIQMIQDWKAERSDWWRSSALTRIRILENKMQKLLLRVIDFIMKVIEKPALELWKTSDMMSKIDRYGIKKDWYRNKLPDKYSLYFLSCVE